MRLIAQKNANNRATQEKSKFWGRKNRSAAEHMVCCDHCGVHLPQSEAVTTSTGIWCSDRHAQLGRSS